MRRICLILLIIFLCCAEVHGIEKEDILEWDQDALVSEIPSDAVDILEDMDLQNLNFTDTVLTVVFRAMEKCTESIRQGIRTSATILIIAMLCNLCSSLSPQKSAVVIVGVLGILGFSVKAMDAMVLLAEQTITDLTEYSALLLPVMASAMAVSGNPVTAGGLYGITVLFSQLLMRLITKLLIPGIYFFLMLAAGECALQNTLLRELREFLGWIMEKALRILLYLYTAFLSLTGIISGTTDALAVKTAKSAVSGMVPVVGSILSDASETLLSGALSIKNSIGLIGLLAVLGITLVPFFRVGIQYLILKITVACSGSVAINEHIGMIKHITAAMGFLLAMTGICGALLLISGVCYLKVAII